MGTNALALTGTAIAQRDEAAFDFTGLRIFTSVPDHRDFGIVALHGMVVVFDETLLGREGIAENAFYVRESQRPNAGMGWDTWLAHEREASPRRGGPVSPLRIGREVVQAIRWRDTDRWAVRLPSGYVDGPYHDWAFGLDLIGKVVGIYLPAAQAGGR